MSRSARRPRRLVGACVAALTLLTGALAACTSDDAGPSAGTPAAPATSTTAPTTTAPPTTTTTVALPPPVPVIWTPCGDGFECARTTVPVDYQDPTGATLEIALVKRPASAPEQRIGTLLVNPGGPGASGVRRVRRGLTISPEVAARFDIVGFDPRGVGESSPITCGASVEAFRQTDLDPDTDEEAAALDAAARAVAEECAATEGERLGHLGTVAVAHDVEVIRRNLGEAQISFVGLSYASLIGLLWADAHPGSVRAMVLDGVVDPAATGDATARAQVEVIDRSFQAMDDACAADPGCPLTAVGRRLADAYDELASRVETGEGQSRGVGPTQLAYAVFSATYGEERWPLLWDAVARGLDGDLGGVADLAGWFTGLVDYVPFALVTCLDAPHPRGFDAWQRDAAVAAEASPRFGATAANELLPCAYWPPATRHPAPVVADGAPTVLVVGTTGDVATPFRQAEAVVASLRSGVMLRVEADGHVAIGSDPCVDEAVTRYLVDLTPPAPPATC